MNDTPEREAALADLQTRLLDFVVKQLEAKAANGEVKGFTQPFTETINAQVTEAVKKGVEEGLTEDQADKLADLLIAKLEIKVPGIFKPGGAGKSGSEGDGTLADAIEGVRQGHTERQQPQISGDESNAPAPGPTPAPPTESGGDQEAPKGWRKWLGPVLSNWRAIVLALLVFGGAWLCWKQYSYQNQQLAAAQKNAIQLDSALAGTCGLFKEIVRESAALKDTAGARCADTANSGDPACRNLAKYKRWNAAAPKRCAEIPEAKPTTPPKAEPVASTNATE